MIQGYNALRAEQSRAGSFISSQLRHAFKTEYMQFNSRTKAFIIRLLFCCFFVNFNTVCLRILLIIRKEVYYD